MEPPNKEPLWELVPPGRRSPNQKALVLPAAKEYPMYRWLRAPNALDEVLLLSSSSSSSSSSVVWERRASHYTVWRENGTLICIGDMDLVRYRGKHVHFTILFHEGKRRALDCAIYGKTDAAIAETATFLWALPYSRKTEACFTIGGVETDDFDFTALQPQQLAHILDANPTRNFSLQAGMWNAEQSFILATRTYPLHLKLIKKKRGGFTWKDDGDAFVAALQRRESVFGSLSIDFDRHGTIFSQLNFRVIFHHGKFETLSSCLLEDEASVLLPLSARADVLDYTIDVRRVPSVAFDSLNIAAKDLTLRISMNCTSDLDEFLTPLCYRLAELGHFERIHLSISCFWEAYGEEDPFEFDDVAPAAEALIDAIQNNPNLTHLNLSDTQYRFDWAPYLQDIFRSMEEHNALRTVVVKKYPEEDPEYVWLKQLYSRNRNVVVLDRSGQRCAIGTSIDQLYLRNRVYQQSFHLAKGSMALRPFLVATALTKSAASESFQLTAILLFGQTDILCGFIQGVSLEELFTA